MIQASNNNFLGGSRVFYELILLWFDNTNQVTRNPIKKFRQNFIVFKKPGFLSKKLKTLTSSNYHRVQYFLLKLLTRFLLTNVYKRVFGFSLFCIDLQLFPKLKKDLVSKHSYLQQKILNFVVVGARNFQFFRHIVWFFRNDRILSKFRYWISYNLISITKL